jgi:small-conductance mechanosensitive channel
MNVIALVLAAGLVVPAASLAQEKSTLAEVAEKTKKDREKKKAGTSDAAKVLTNDDLRSAKGNVMVLGGVPASSTTGTPAAGAAAAAAEPTDEELREQKSADLQAQLDAQADFIKRLRESADQTQSELNDLGNYVFGGRRAALAQIVEERQKQIAEAERAIADLEEQARRAGVSLRRP